MYLIHYIRLSAVINVYLVNKYKDRDTVFCEQLPENFCVALDAVAGIYNKNSAVHNGQRPFSLGGKIRMTRSVKERVDPVPPMYDRLL